MLGFGVASVLRGEERGELAVDDSDCGFALLAVA
jgi:hypothetical protein